MGSIAKKVSLELLPFFRVYEDGSVERLIGSPQVPPLDDPRVSTKDIIISKNPPLSARLYLPKPIDPEQKLPILVYFHGGAFCIDSAFSLDENKYMNNLVSEAKVLAISIEYRLAPENPLPIAYEDSWTTLQWVASHACPTTVKDEPWLSTHGNFQRLFLGGDSAGANLVHNIAMRAGVEGLNGGVTILGMYVTHPYFIGSKPVGSETSKGMENSLGYAIWKSLYPSAFGGMDSPMVNPLGPGAPSLAGLGCSRLLVSVAELDELKSRGVWYYDGVKGSGWKGEAELVEVEGEDHGFHVLRSDSENGKNLIKRLASFLCKSAEK